MKLIDICELIVDCPHTTASDQGEGYPLIRTPNIGKGRFILDSVHRVDEKTYVSRNARAVPQDDDLIFAREAPAGNVAIIKNGQKVCLGQRTVLIRPNKDLVDPDYLTYYLLAPQQQHELLCTANGATVLHVNLPIIRNLKINIPEAKIQRRIADTLSAYDDLIENNQKQIKLLEKAAMCLYKEWFVKFRFPGHESIEVVDGVPKRWNCGVLKDFIAVNGKSINKNYKFDNIQYVDIGSVRNGTVEHKTVFQRINAPGRAKRLAHDGDVIWGMVRPNLRAHALILTPEENDVFSTGFAVLTPTLIPYTFLYCFVTQDEFVGYLVNCTNGAAYPAVKPEHFENAKVIIPNTELLLLFNQYADPYFKKINVIDRQIRQLRIARDKLLPKLMSGEIEV